MLFYYYTVYEFESAAWPAGRVPSAAAALAHRSFCPMAALDTALVESLKGLAGSADDGSRTGLLIGTHSSAGAPIVMFAAPTPQQEGDDAEAEWAAAHASQVQRMLLGGLRIVGTFCAGAPRDMSAITQAVAVLEEQMGKVSETQTTHRLTTELYKKHMEMLKTASRSR